MTSYKIIPEAKGRIIVFADGSKFTMDTITSAQVEYLASINHPYVIKDDESKGKAKKSKGKKDSDGDAG